MSRPPCRLPREYTSWSVHRQVAADLPAADALDVLLPLVALGFEEVLVDVAPDGVLNDLVLLELIQRVAQVPGQLVDPQMAPLTEAHLVDVLVDRRSGIQVVLDPLEAGAER